MRSDFETWITGLTDDDGSGTTGDIVNKAFFNTQMGLIDDAINTTGGLITTDTTYYVATTGSDTTGDGSVTTPWATPSKALSELGNYRVQEGKTVTIQCDDGTYTLTSTITNLPKGFTLAGKNSYTKTMSSVQSSSGSTGSWSVVINLNNVSSITTSDYAIISAASGGTNPKYIEGVWDITAVDAVNNRITVSTTHRGASAPASTVTATVTIPKTQFFFVGTSGFSIARMHGGTISNCLVRGDGTALTYGILVNRSTLGCSQTVGIFNFGGNGINATINGAVSAGTLVISNCGGYGAYALDGYISAVSAIISGNTSIGVYCSGSGSIVLEGATISGNGGYGINATKTGTIDAYAAVLNANTTYDVFAEKYAYIWMPTATIAGSTSPAVNTQGNEYGYIDT